MKCKRRARALNPLVFLLALAGPLLTAADTPASAMGAHSLVIHNDPNADGFYRAADGQVVGQAESDSVPGRMLAVFEIQLRCPPRP